MSSLFLAQPKALVSANLGLNGESSQGAFPLRADDSVIEACLYHPLLVVSPVFDGPPLELESIVRQFFTPAKSLSVDRYGRFISQVDQLEAYEDICHLSSAAAYELRLSGYTSRLVKASMDLFHFRSLFVDEVLALLQNFGAQYSTQFQGPWVSERPQVASYVKVSEGFLSALQDSVEIKLL